MYLLMTLLFALSSPFFYSSSGTNGLEQTGNCTTVDGITCNVTNGTGAGGLCSPGWTGPDCDEQCADGTFGQNCSGLCFCEDGYPCDVINGSCPDDICAPGWQGDTCSLRCGFGTFGANCSGVCNCGSGTCDTVGGNCTSGICAAGWQGETCSTACGFGTFGANCNGECNCESGTCDTVGGNCTGGICAAGWQGETCSTVCASGTFGYNCNGTCHCREDSCDVTTGQCPDNACGPGWQGPVCQQSCDSGLYGEECSYTCNCWQDEDCDHVTGKCSSGCPPDWAGEACQYRIPPAPREVIVKNVTTTTATLEWKHANTEPYGYMVQYRFYPYRADDNWQNSTIIHGVLTTYTILNLQPATEYIYNIMTVSDEQIASRVPGISELIHKRFTTTGALPPSSGESSGLSTGAVVGIVFGCLLGVAGLAALTVYFFRRYPFKMGADGTAEQTVIFSTNDDVDHRSSSCHIYDQDVLENHQPEATIPPRVPRPVVPPREPQPETPSRPPKPQSARASQPTSQNKAPLPPPQQTEPKTTAPPTDLQANEMYNTVFGNGVEAKYFEIPIDHLQVFEGIMLGQGNFGKVYKGKLKKRGQMYNVAVKKSKESQESVNDFVKELVVVSQVAHVGQHENIVKFMGAVTAKQDVENIFLVYEFADEGELRKWLKNEHNIPQVYRTQQSIHTRIYSNNRTPLQTLLHFGIDVCKGMMHLAEAKVNHGDLAARNVLLFSKGNEITAKVTDFGLAEDLYKEEEKSGNVKGEYDRSNETCPVKWSAPEIILYGKFTAKSDVWSFGILLWEIFSFGGTPYTGIKNKDMANYLMQGERLSSPPLCPTLMFKIMKSCWKMTPEERPGFDELLNELLKFEGSISHRVGEKVISVYEEDDEEDDEENVGYVDVLSRGQAS